jgi:hypothetical protein
MNDRVSKEKMLRQRQPKICGRTIDAIEHFEIDKERSSRVIKSRVVRKEAAEAAV